MQNEDSWRIAHSFDFRKTMKILAITNQKGGVGKTTTAVNLSACLAALQRRVLLIDLDPQGNATTGVGVFKKEALPTVYQLLIGKARFEEVKITTQFGFDLMPANRELSGAEVELVELSEREMRLKKSLKNIEALYDFVIIDCPPALNMLTVNGLVAAQAVLIPMQCEYYALEGLSDLVETLRKIKKLNKDLEIEGLLRTMFNPQGVLNQQVSQELEKYFPNKIYQSIIPRNVRLAEAPSYGKPILFYDKSSRGARAYMDLACEMLGK